MNFFPRERFETMLDRPLLREHNNVARQIDIDLAALHELAGLANQRIRSTGDLVPITIGHQPSPSDLYRGARPAPVVGFAGPFFVRRHVDRWALYGDLRVYREEGDLLRQYPRVSCEIWRRHIDNQERAVLEQVALMSGASELDLGLCVRTPQGLLLTR